MNPPTGCGPSRAHLYFDGDQSKYELWEVKFLAHVRTLKLASTILPATDGGVADGDKLYNLYIISYTFTPYIHLPPKENQIA